MHILLLGESEAETRSISSSNIQVHTFAELLLGMLCNRTEGRGGLVIAKGGLAKEVGRGTAL